MSVTIARVNQSNVREIWQQWVDGKTSVAPAGNKSLSDFHRLATLKYDYLPTNLKIEA